MNASELISKQFGEVYFSGNWTASNLFEQLEDVSWEEATTQVYDLNTLATLQYHIHYYVRAQLKVLKGGPLDAKDALSFDHTKIGSAEDWKNVLAQAKKEAVEFEKAIAALKDNRLEEDFVDAKYGSYYRNLHGLIDHTYYHLGQIAILKKIIRAQLK